MGGRRGKGGEGAVKIQVCNLGDPQQPVLYRYNEKTFIAPVLNLQRDPPKLNEIKSRVSRYLFLQHLCPAEAV